MGLLETLIIFILLPVALALVNGPECLTMNFWYDGRESPRLKKIQDFHYTSTHVHVIYMIYFCKSENHKYRYIEMSQQKQVKNIVLITCIA